jgi:hypothetical protein
MAERDAEFKHQIASHQVPPGLLSAGGKPGSQKGERFGKVGGHFVGRFTRPGTGSNADAQPNPSRSACFHIAHFIAHNRAVSRVEPKLRYGLQEHSRVRFAPWMIATVFANSAQRMMRAVINPGDRRAFRFKATAHPPCQLAIGGLVEIAATDAGLIGDDNDRPPQLIGPEASQLENPRNKLELIRPMDVAAVHIDDSIPVKEKRAVRHDPDHPLARVIGGRGRASQSPLECASTAGDLS